MLASSSHSTWMGSCLVNPSRARENASEMSSTQVCCCIYMLILKYIVNVEANIVDLDQAASVRAARSGSPMFNQMVRVYTM